MLAVKTYPPEYVQQCRAAVGALLDAYEGVSGADAFEPLFCNHMVLALDQYFVHRQRGLEGKDGNPINEVRVLAASIAANGGVMAADSTVKMKPEALVLGYAPGDSIRIDAAGLRRLADAYFDEIGRRFGGD